MIHALIRAHISTTHLLPRKWRKITRRILFIVVAMLLSSSVQLSSHYQKAHAEQRTAQQGCTWYAIRNGDTLTNISKNVHVDVPTLALTNDITNINLIFAGRSLCIPPAGGLTGHQYNLHGEGHTGILPNGTVRWYAYDALEGSTYQHVDDLLHHAAASYGLPLKLVLAIARQESNFRHHVISTDGGIGVMQIMPDTAMWINAVTGIKRDPYKLVDNIFMGAFYIRALYNTFNQDIVRVVSAYNAGGWTVTHRGIINWNYVNRVLATIRNL